MRGKSRQDHGSRVAAVAATVLVSITLASAFFWSKRALPLDVVLSETPRGGSGATGTIVLPKAMWREEVEAADVPGLEVRDAAGMKLESRAFRLDGKRLRFAVLKGYPELTPPVTISVQSGFARASANIELPPAELIEFVVAPHPNVSVTSTAGSLKFSVPCQPGRETSHWVRLLATAHMQPHSPPIALATQYERGKCVAALRLAFPQNAKRVRFEFLEQRTTRKSEIVKLPDAPWGDSVCGKGVTVPTTIRATGTLGTRLSIPAQTALNVAPAGIILQGEVESSHYANQVPQVLISSRNRPSVSVALYNSASERSLVSVSPWQRFGPQIPSGSERVSPGDAQGAEPMLELRWVSGVKSRRDTYAVPVEPG
jgi:hypothetical protein